MDVTYPSEQTPGDLFAPFGSLQKGLAARRRRNPSKSTGAVQTRREGQAPPLRGNGPHMSRNGRPHGATPTKSRERNVEPTAGASPRPTALRHTGAARQGCRTLQVPRVKQREVALPPIRCTPPKIAQSHTFIGNCAPLCPFATKKSPAPGSRGSHTGIASPGQRIF